MRACIGKRLAGVLFFLNRGPSYQKASLTIKQDLTPIELSEEEKRALQDAGLTIPSGEDVFAKDLQRVRSSDDLGAIEAELNLTRQNLFVTLGYYIYQQKVQKVKNLLMLVDK